ncbi:MAG: hypothetical protein MZV64_33890 [Ignavibacteriales bacterium]|nr:hypothetical protein [Ignavibacteriales bacterium]
MGLGGLFQRVFGLSFIVRPVFKIVLAVCAAVVGSLLFLAALLALGRVAGFLEKGERHAVHDRHPPLGRGNGPRPGLPSLLDHPRGGPVLPHLRRDRQTLLGLVRAPGRPDVPQGVAEGLLDVCQEPAPVAGARPGEVALDRLLRELSVSRGERLLLRRLHPPRPVRLPARRPRHGRRPVRGLPRRRRPLQGPGFHRRAQAGQPEPGPARPAPDGHHRRPGEDLGFLALRRRRVPADGLGPPAHAAAPAHPGAEVHVRVPPLQRSGLRLGRTRLCRPGALRGRAAAGGLSFAAGDPAAHFVRGEGCRSPLSVDPDELDRLAVLDHEPDPEVVEPVEGEQRRGHGHEPVFRARPLVEQLAVLERDLALAVDACVAHEDLRVDTDQVLLGLLAGQDPLVFGFPLGRSGLGGQLLDGHRIGPVESLGGRHGDVRRDARPLPVRLRDGVDGPGEGHPQDEVRLDDPRARRVGAAAGGLADDGRPLQVLHVVGEFLGPGEGPGAGQDIEVGIGRPGPGT